MNAEQTRSDDDLPEPESAPGLPLFEAAGVEIPAYVEELTQGQPLGPAMKKLYVSMQKRKAQQAEPPPAREEEKPEPLPLVTEEELAEIADPRERERMRAFYTKFYKDYPNGLALARERSAALIAERKKPVLLEPWANDRRAAPNAVFRSALFPALNTKQRRRFVQNQKVYSVGGLDIVFTGQQFDQTDLDVYLEILNLAKAVPLGQPVRFSAYAMLKALGRCTGKSDHQWLHAVLVRLRGGTVEMVTDKARLFGGLIEGGIRDEITKHYDVVINPSYAKFFGFGLWSSIDIDQRRQLAQKSTAKALHAYYSTHTDPAPHRYDTLAGVVGLDNKNRRELRASLIRAHEELKRVGFLLDYDAGPDKIAIKATMTPGQQQHLVRKVAKAPKPRKTP
jgi:hypothetical protein